MSRLFVIAALIVVAFWLVGKLRRRPFEPRSVSRVAIKEVPPVMAMERLPASDARIPGRRTILVATYSAAATLLLDWVQFLTLAKSGVALGASALLLCWAYPFLVAYKSWPMHLKAAKLCAATAMLGGLIVLGKTSHISVLWMSLNVTGIGVLAYLCCSAVFYLGVSRYANAKPYRRGPAHEPV